MPEKKCYALGTSGVSVNVKARPGARNDSVIGPRGGELVVAVRAKPEKGLANEAIRRVLAEALGVPRDSVSLKLGPGSPHKVFVVPREALAALAKLCVTE